jgi:hypothetical protein
MRIAVNRKFVWRGRDVMVYMRCHPGIYPGQEMGEIVINV